MYTSNYRFSEPNGVNATPVTETQLVVDLSYKAAGARGVLLSEAPLKEFPTTPITLIIGGTTYTEVDITAGFPANATDFAVEYSSNSGVIYLHTSVALGTSCTITYKATGTVASIESKQYNLDGTVGAPGISFANDTNTGIYRIGADNLGFSANGAKTAELNSLGVLNGTLGTDRRNLIQFVQGQNTGVTIMRTNNLWVTPTNTQYQLCLQGLITPRSSFSTIAVKGFITIYTSAAVNSFLRLYYNTTSYGTPQSTQQVALPSGTQIGTLLMNNQSGASRTTTPAPILGFMTGHAAGTPYYISLWLNYNTSATQMNIDNTLSEIFFEEWL